MIIVRTEHDFQDIDILLFFDSKIGKLYVKKYKDGLKTLSEVKKEINNFLGENGLEHLDFKLICNSPVENAYSAPIKLFLDITDECNLECKHCLNTRLNSKHYLSLDVIKQIANECEKLGIFYVKLGGGEPLLHPNFSEIIKILREKNIFISLSTNGYFIDESIAKLLYENQVKVTVSIEGPERIDAEIRGKDHFDVAVNALRILKRNKVNVSFRVTLTKYLLNTELIENLRQLAMKEQVKVKFAYCKPSGLALDNQMIIGMEDKKEYYEIINILNEPNNLKYFIIENGMMKNQDKYYEDFYYRGKGCGAGSRTMHIDALGIISACVFIRKWYDSITSYLDTSIETFWKAEDNKSSDLLKMIRNISFPEECKECQRNCNGQCMALRLYNTGSLLGYNVNCLK